MGGFIEPNIHPVLVHFTYALGTSAALAYVAGLLVPAGRWRDSLRPAADWMLALAAYHRGRVSGLLQRCSRCAVP